MLLATYWKLYVVFNPGATLPSLAKEWRFECFTSKAHSLSEVKSC